MTLGITGVVIGVLLLVVSYCCNWQARLQYRHIPGPAPRFPLGNLQTVLKKQLFRAHQDWQKAYGDVYKFFWARQPVVVITDPKLVHQITIKDFKNWKDKCLPAVDNPLLSGKAQEANRSFMIIAKSPLWGSLRAGAQPMFHSHSLQAYAGTINQALDQLVSNLKAVASSGRPVDILQQLSQLTMQVIGTAAFGVDFDCQRDATQEQVPLVAACKAAFDNALPSKWAMLAMLAPGPFLPFVKLLSRLLPTRTDAVVTKAVRFLYDTSACLIENCQEAARQVRDPMEWIWFKRDPANPYKHTVPAGKSIIPLLLKANNKGTGQHLTSLQIAAQSSLFMLAGYETTAVTIAQCIYMLTTHPEVQQKLQQEVDECARQPKYEDLEQLPYTAAVIHETLRLVGPSVFLTRVAAQDTKLGPYAVPRGTVVHISMYTMHHDERWWQEAELFKPERWIGDKTGGDRSGGLAYMPFGNGPRQCIGMKLAGGFDIIGAMHASSV